MLRERIYWLIRLRWIAVIGVVSAILFTTQILKLSLPIFPLYFITIILIVYNLGFFLLLTYSKLKGSSVILNRIANLQISLDLVCLLGLIYFSGGIENPFIFYFIFHMIIASILLSRRASYLQATFISILFVLMLGLEQFNFLKHYCLKGFITYCQQTNKIYGWGISLCFISTLYLAVYMASSISMKLRQREKGLEEARDELYKEGEELKRVYQELKESQLELIQAEKLAGIGQLAAGMAHEINNPLFVISGRAEMLSGDELKDKETKDAARIIMEQSHRIKEIIARLLNFSRRKEFKLEPLDINKVVEESLSLLKYQIKIDNIEIIKELSPGLPKISGDNDQMQEVFLNIGLNAIQAMQKGGRLTITTRREKVTNRGRRNTDRLKLGQELVVIEFQDTGKGMDYETLKKIFDPFFTTKEKSTGLGLSISYRIIENHKGAIEAFSKLGEGTTFMVKLPISEGG